MGGGLSPLTAPPLPPQVLMLGRWHGSVTLEAPDGVATMVPDDRYERDEVHGWVYGHHTLSRSI